MSGYWTLVCEISEILTQIVHCKTTSSDEFDLILIGEVIRQNFAGVGTFASAVMWCRDNAQGMKHGSLGGYIV